MNLVQLCIRLACLICLSLMVSSCKTVKLIQSPGIIQVDNQSNHIKAGVGRAELTVPPGHSMGGYGKELAKVSRGWWTRLYATANYFEDTSGHMMVIVSADLWSISGIICDKVIEELHAQSDSNYHLARETILFAATHTHHSQGNYSSTWVYNAESSAETGFDSELSDYLAKQIASAIIQAIDDKEEAIISYSKAKIIGLTRNRSLPAFLQNPDRQNIINDVASLPNSILSRPTHCLTGNDTVYMAIDPYLTSLKIQSLANNQIKSLVCSFGGHPTVLGVDNNLLSADLFGVSRSIIENSYPNTLVSFLNGTVGDVSYNWLSQNRQTTEELGLQYAQSIIAQVEDSIFQNIHSDFKTSLTFKKLKDRKADEDIWNEFDGINFNPVKTDKRATIGKATLEGAEDGRTHGLTLSEECTYDESRAKNFSGPQGNKDVFFLLNFAIKGDPQYLPMGIYSLGDLHFISIPGEPSVGLCNRISNAVNTLKQGNTVIVSMANEYLSYFTTPSEYALQHYEGSSTVYGAATGILLEQDYKSLAALSSYQGEYYKHEPEFPVGSEIKKQTIWEDMKTDSIDMGAMIQKVYAHNKSFTYDSDHTINTNHPTDALPTAQIEINTNGQWTPLIISTNPVPGVIANTKQSDQNSSNFLIYARQNAGLLKWSVRWMKPMNYLSNESHRLVLKIGNTNYTELIDQSILNQ